MISVSVLVLSVFLDKDSGVCFSLVGYLFFMGYHMDGGFCWAFVFYFFHWQGHYVSFVLANVAVI